MNINFANTYIQTLLNFMHEFILEILGSWCRYIGDQYVLGDKDCSVGLCHSGHCV